MRQNALEGPKVLSGYQPQVCLGYVEDPDPEVQTQVWTRVLATITRDGSHQR